MIEQKDCPWMVFFYGINLDFLECVKHFQVGIVCEYSIRLNIGCF